MIASTSIMWSGQVNLMRYSCGERQGFVNSRICLQARPVKKYSTIIRMYILQSIPIAILYSVLTICQLEHSTVLHGLQQQRSPFRIKSHVPYTDCVIISLLIYALAYYIVHRAIVSCWLHQVFIDQQHCKY